MGSESGFDESLWENEAKLKITDKPSKEQKKIKAKLSKDRKSITLTAVKKTPVGTSAYFLIAYNQAYKIFKVTATGSAVTAK